MGPRLAPEVRVYADPARQAAAAARHLAERARSAVRARGRFSWVLAGGHTPERLYRVLARRYRSRFPWKETEIFFGDERCVGPRSSDSNYAMAREALLAHVPIPSGRIHRLRGELRPARVAAERYAARIESSALAGSSPRFDVVLLGLGPDGHTASLFPGAPALRERRRWVVSVPRAGHPPWVPRLSLTYPAIASSREVIFLVEGLAKAPTVARVLGAGARGSPRLPASLVRSHGSVRWYLDRAAASRLGPGRPGRSAPAGRD